LEESLAVVPSNVKSELLSSGITAEQGEELKKMWEELLK
jgi:hypothetical protein